MYLVTGATGNVGGPVARQLHEHGHSVRALVRDPSRAAGLPAGIELAVGNLDDPESVAKAVQGVEAVFLMQVGGGTEQTKKMIDAARAAGSPRIVLQSSVGARLFPQGPIQAALAAREQIMRESGLGVTYLRPNGFASNALWWLDSIRAGKVVDTTGDGRQGVIDPEDIARVAVATLTEDGHVGKGYFLTGPQALTAREQVEIIAEVTGRSIDFEDVTPHEFAQAAIRRGTPPEQAHAMESLNELFRAGRAGFVTDDVENITGAAPGTFRDWCERNVDAFR
ncbi:NAD(P)H-binding protein [Streptantibioticus ferralitis]|uniref:NAD(P)H-binding protein n=1 Tax=Streptantibioticus ferralitis TaxID=236510 RepID=A0ABT5Z1H5_9ACTN|nr:NAD(P)H-binding protein [Streptantibioticus ferralitis]MDF2257544.1 NAD(P)H-binding protein [Streptantibioticus ferralitis]